MTRLVAGLAFIASAVAFLVVAGGGLALLLIENSGERGAGALLALSGAVCFAAAMTLLFARQRAFAGHGGRAGALTATLLGVLPPAALSIAALRFAGLPWGSPLPLFDWSAFAAGLALAVGALAVLAVGYRRMVEARRGRPARVAQPELGGDVMPRSAAPSEGARQPARGKQRAREMGREPRAEASAPETDEVRVTPVDLPSIGQFRRS